jgi:3'-phosphoadenosine 5'-phosphosulfate sulfotransferase (PAPS reductase)/FAD synthetase
LKVKKERIMNSPYKSEENTLISLSGGRTSALMLYRVLQAYDFKLPDNFKICFANTGKEMPQTLDFLKRIGKEWGVDVVWLERYAEVTPKGHKNKYIYKTRVVDYDSAARNGEPFRSLVLARSYAPNPVARFCTVDLKIRAMQEYLRDVCEWEMPYVGFIGIRADEQRRAIKMHGTEKSGQESYLPLYLDGVTKEDVYSFWQNSSFDLDLPNNNGTTDWGNCDLCFLKGFGKKLAIVRERPDLADWWIEMEAELSEKVGKGAYFRADQPSYADMKIIATSQPSFDFFDDDETIPCFCGD